MEDLIRRSDAIGLLEDMILFGEYGIIASSFSKADEEEAYRAINDIPAVNRWILCEDELSERDTNVLIYYPAWQDAPVQTAHIMSDGSCWEFSDGEFYPSMKDITHWMPLPPLPEPPEKE